MKQIQEEYIQQQSIIWLNNTYGLKHHKPRLLMYSVANEIGASVSGAIDYALQKRFTKTITDTFKRTYNKFKLTGLKNGVADTHVLLPNGKIIFVEFKTPTGTQRKEQKEFQLHVEELGFEYYIIRSVEEFKELINVQLSKQEK